MDRYRPLKANATKASVLLMDTDADKSHLWENALLRIRAATSLLETLASVAIQTENDAHLQRLFLSAYLPLQDGLDLLEHLDPKR
jgi:PleD family two-component response regulator